MWKLIRCRFNRSMFSLSLCGLGDCYGIVSSSWVCHDFAVGRCMEFVEDKEGKIC